MFPVSSLPVRTFTMKKFFFPLVLALFAAACLQELPQAPKLEAELPVAGSEEIWKASEQEGKPVLISFMGTWCPWCKRSLPALDAAAQAFEGKAVVVGAFVDDDEDAVLEVVKEHEMKTKALYDARQAAQNMGVSGFPHIMLFDKKHRLVKVWNGYGPDLEVLFQEELSKVAD